MNKDHAVKVLTQHIPLLRSCILDAWQQSLTIPFRHNYELRTKSSLMRDLIVANVKEKFSSIAGTKLLQANKLFFLEIDSYLIRFKKLDDNRLPRNYQTPQAVALERQQLEIPGTNGRVFLTAGYMTDSFETKIVSAFLTCQRGKSNDWEIMLGGEEHGFITLPTQQSLDEFITIRPRKELIEKEVFDESLQSKS